MIDFDRHVVIQMKANKFFLVVIAVFFDSNFQRTNFYISSTQRFYSKEVVECIIFLQAPLLAKRISKQTTVSEFPDQRVKGIMRTSGEIDFRFRLKLKIT